MEASRAIDFLAARVYEIQRSHMPISGGERRMEG
jgi:hypothetical protein